MAEQNLSIESNPGSKEITGLIYSENIKNRVNLCALLFVFSSNSVCNLLADRTRSIIITEIQSY